jgi:SpoVK/Ycf46/Vps4 family AAA+-type ATPase
VSTKQLPAFRFPDLHSAIDWFAEKHGKIAELQSEHENVFLNTLLHDRWSQWAKMPVKQSRLLGWMVDVDKERSLPVDHFWVVGQGGARMILRLSYNQYALEARLEAAGLDEAAAARAIQEILDRSIAHSIYRNQIIELAFVTGTRDEYGDVEKPEHLRLLFKRMEPVGEEDIVIDEDVRSVLVRNIVDLHERRDILKANGVPVRRGVLLYGPPGTGKTYACRYVFARLPQVTRIAVAGTALSQVGHIFNLARLYQPSLVLLEDVDLVFASREINLYSSVLGELLDQMDGLRPFEDIGFLLTTNSIERMEAAIKDRPGRIGQCIHFGPPKAALRRRYLAHYLSGYEQEDVDLDALVKMSEDATQAFLKEWVHRSVQIATERLNGPEGRARLRTEDFEAAMDEMKRFAEGSTGRIVGFIRPQS